MNWFEELLTLHRAPYIEADPTLSDGFMLTPFEPRPSNRKKPVDPVAAPKPAPPLASKILVELEISVEYVRTLIQATAGLKHLSRLQQTIGFDIETSAPPEFTEDREAGLNPHTSRIRTLQFFDGQSRAFVFDCNGVPFELLAPLFKKRLVAHNATFEWKFIHHAGIRPEQIDCTRLMARLLETRESSNLQSVAKRVLNLALDKSLQISDWSLPELSKEHVAYSALDAVLPLLLARKLWPEIKTKGLERVYRLQANAIPAVAKMELAGVHFDTAAHASVLDEWQLKQVLAGTELRRQVGPELNLDSPRQLSGYLERTLGPEDLNTWSRTSGGQLVTADEVLSRFVSIEWIRQLTEYRKFAKLVGTYGASYAAHMNRRTSRIHASFVLAAASSGRIACRHPNLQNCPRDPKFRSLFTAPPGRILVVGDYSQIELRVIAELSQDEAMLAAFREGRDLHRLTASIVAGIPENAVTKEQRQAAKAINFGLSFGMKARGLAEYARSAYGVDLSFEQASGAREKFFAAYRGLAEWQRQQIARARRNREVRTPSGCVRCFGRDEDYRIPTEALNHPVQGAAAECMLVALVSLERELEGTSGVIVNCVHDEIVCECDESDVRRVEEILEQAMTGGFRTMFPDSSIVGLVEASHGPNWAACK